MLEALQAAFLERVDADDLSAPLDRFAQRLKHPGVVSAWVLAPDEDRLGMLEIVEGHRALADADTLPQCHTAGFMAHVRAVWKVVGAVGTNEQLVEKCRFVAGAARGVELGLIRACQVLQVSGDQGEGGLPADGLVAVGCGVVAHRFGEPALVLKPVIALLQQ